MGKYVAILFCLCLSVGCSTKAIYVPSGEPMQIRKDTKVQVWIKNAQGVKIPSKVVAKSGWYILPKD